MNTPFSRRHFVLSNALLAGMAALPGMAHAAWAPNKPIRLVVPWAAGGSTDAIGRAVAQRMQETIGQPVVVENRPGANAQIGTDLVAKSPPDGYTITILELPHAIAPALVAKLPYDILRDFTPITMLGTSPLVLFGTASGSAPADVKAFIKAAGGNTPLAMANSGNGSASHLGALLLGDRAKVKFNHIPYKGAAPALTDVAAGAAQGCFATLASGSGLLSTGKLRALVVAAPARMPVAAMASVPTFVEAGIKDLDMPQWWALVAPATTPLDVVERLRTEAIAALAHPSVRTRLEGLGIGGQGSSRDALRAFMRNEVARWGEAAAKAGLRPE
jgi:tripartite-type tricarboxylate transporter receptor subunit TctC